jgi:hypothetical protein
MYIHLEIIVVKLAARLSDNPAGVSVQRHPIVRLATIQTVGGRKRVSRSLSPRTDPAPAKIEIAV